MTKKPGVAVLIFNLLFLTSAFSQNDQDLDLPPQQKSKFLTGFYIGPYFANNYSAGTYNGYGFDIDGNPNPFLNSLMYQKIKNEYGGGYGQYDQIAEALGVDRGQWEFNESDMPVNMHYVPATLFGFNFKVPVDKKSAIIFNINGTKLSIEGSFTMSTLKPQTQPVNPATNPNLHTLAIRGKEQRLLFEMGFQRLFGKDDKLNFMAEAGFLGTLAKYDQNTIYINTLTIDLTNYYNQSINTSAPARKPIGFGIGAFASIGVNMNINPKFTLQLLYTLSQEKVNIGTNPALKFQHAVGFRVYYNFRSGTAETTEKESGN